MRSWLFAVLSSLCLGLTAHASVPSSISVQGRLTDSLGVPLPSGVKGFWFRIFDAPAGGNQIWSGEDQFLMTDSDGLWNATLGTLVGLNDAVFSDTVRWLDVTVSGVTLPRIRLVTGPFAHRVSTVDGASGGTITSKVSIGPGHTNTGTNAFVAGEGSVTSGDYAAISGGKNDTASGSYSSVGGGLRNRAGANYSTVGGGLANRAMNDYSTIGGGNSNFATFGSTVAGGQSNDASAINGASIVGGVGNTADGSFSSIGGGYNNQAYGDYSTISGGGGNNADSNVTRGLGATIPGGRRNRANGNFSLAAGRRAHALHHGTFVWADSTEADFASTAQDQFLIRATNGVGVGTNDPEGPFHVQNGSAGAVTANGNSVAVFESNTSGGWISVLGPATQERGLLFSEPGNSVAGAIVFDQGGGGDDIGFRTGGNVTNMTLDASGNLNVTGNITASGNCCASDLRFKRNVTTLSGSVEKVEALRGVRYEWKCDEFPDRRFSPGEQIGLIAQEVRQVVPQAVIEQPDGYLAVDYARLVPLLIEGMKEQQEIINRQNARIANLEKKFEQ